MFFRPWSGLSSRNRLETREEKEGNNVFLFAGMGGRMGKRGSWLDGIYVYESPLQRLMP